MEPPPFGPDYHQAGRPKPLHQVFGADSGEEDVRAAWQAARVGDRLAENGRDFMVGQFIVGQIE
jgi:hypothetical protein